MEAALLQVRSMCFYSPLLSAVGPLATLLPLAVVLLITLLATALPSIVKQL